MPQVYYSTISINAAQVPTTQTNFPVLVSVTDARFKTIGNGGHVSNTNGFDIRPYTDTTLSVPITGYELERYNASTGEVIMWVKVASLSSSTTPIVLGYGDASLTTDGSSTTTWSNGFLGVYHFKDGTSLNVNSSTGSNNGTATNTPTATAGQIDGAVAVASVSSQYVALPANVNPVSYSAWINATSFPNALNSVIVKNGTGVQGNAFMWVTLAGLLQVQFGGGSINSSITLSTATWYYVVGQNESSINVQYINGANRLAGTAVSSSTNGTNLTQIGSDQAGGGRYFNGKIDEARISSVARSAAGS